MAAQGFTLFDTPIGRCGIGWSARGIACVQLPEAREGETRARVQKRCPGAREAPPPPEVRSVVDGISALLSGTARTFDEATLDMEGVPPFHRRVYEISRTIPPGKTLSYGEIARRLGAPGSARAVGQALGRNPFAIVVPCHRVLAAGGKPGGFSANGGVATKARMLALEGGPRGSELTLFGGGGELSFDTGKAVSHLKAADRTLGRLIDGVGPFTMRLETTTSLFAALSQSIVYQQLTGKAAATIFGRVKEVCGHRGSGPTAERVLATPDDTLRAAGLSRAKVLSLKDLAGKTEAGKLPTLKEIHEMDDEAIIVRLTKVRGIGRWSAEMLLMFRLGRPDVLPVDDYGIRKGFAAAFRKQELPTRKDLARRGERWAPYRTVASWYLWRAAERARK